MSISYSDVRGQTESPSVLALLLVNASLMLFFVLAWPAWPSLLAEPIEWALADAGNSRLDLRAYPYSVLWALPLACCTICSFANRYGMTLLARVAGFTPPLLLGLVFAWFHLAPLTWR